MAARLMRAIRVLQFGGPEVLQLADNVPVPKPEDSQVLIRVHCAGVNPVETYIRAGNYGALPTLPFTPGSDLAGIVQEVGKKVNTFKPGDRVFTVRTVTGSYAEYAVAEESRTFPLHPSLDYKQGATLGCPYFTAYKALVNRGGVQPGDTVLVHGASGAVGLAACQIARATGCHVIGTAGSAQGLALVKKNGAHLTFNHRDDGYMEQIAEYAKSGVNVLVEMLANENLEKDMALMAQKGRIVIVGSRGSLVFNPRSTMSKELDIRGMALAASSTAELATISAAVVAGCEAGWIKPEIGQEFALQEAAQAHTEVIEHKSGSTGRIVLNVT